MCSLQQESLSATKDGNNSSSKGDIVWVWQKEKRKKKKIGKYGKGLEKKNWLAEETKRKIHIF